MIEVFGRNLIKTAANGFGKIAADTKPIAQAHKFMTHLITEHGRDAFTKIETTSNIAAKHGVLDTLKDGAKNTLEHLKEMLSKIDGVEAVIKDAKDSVPKTLEITRKWYKNMHKYALDWFNQVRANIMFIVPWGSKKDDFAKAVVKELEGQGDKPIHDWVNHVIDRVIKSEEFKDIKNARYIEKTIDWIVEQGQAAIKKTGS